MKPKIPVTQAVLLLSPHFPDAIIIPTRSNFSVCAEAGLSGLEIWLRARLPSGRICVRVLGLVCMVNFSAADDAPNSTQSRAVE